MIHKEISCWRRGGEGGFFFYTYLFVPAHVNCNLDRPLRGPREHARKSGLTRLEA